MVELTDDARQELEAYFKDKEKHPLRIFLAPGGCGGARLILVLDEPNDTDSTEDVGGFTFCINKDLLGRIKSAKVDLSPTGFDIKPEVPFPDTGVSGCSGCCGGCGSK